MSHRIYISGLYAAHACDISSVIYRSLNVFRGKTERMHWTAGQRIDQTRKFEIIWQVTSTDTYSDTLFGMTFANWDRRRRTGRIRSMRGFHEWPFLHTERPKLRHETLFRM